MASIYKRSQDEGKNRAAWYFNYTDHTGKQRTLYSDNYFFRLTTIGSFGLSGSGERREPLSRWPDDY